MKNRIVGIIVIGIAALIGFIVYIFNRALTKITGEACTHGFTCPMWGTLDFHTYLALGIMIFVILIGLYLIFFGKEEKIVTKIKKVKEQIQPKKLTKEHYQKITKKLNNDEKNVLDNIIDNNGSIFQSELVEKTNLTKVKVTRVLDKLEGQGIIERKRRGMTNIVLLKH